jgi:hypothetical protein
MTVAGTTRKRVSETWNDSGLAHCRVVIPRMQQSWFSQQLSDARSDVAGDSAAAIAIIS